MGTRNTSPQSLYVSLYEGQQDGRQKRIRRERLDDYGLRVDWQVSKLEPPGQNLEIC